MHIFKRIAVVIPLVLICFNAFSQDSTTCTDKLLGTIHFHTNGAILSKASKVLLDSIFTQIKLHPACKVSIKSYLPSADYSSQQEAWDRAYIVVWYLKKKGVNEQRFLFSYDEPGKQSITTLKFTNGDGPFIAVPPLPGFCTIKNISWKEVDSSLELQFQKK